MILEELRSIEVADLNAPDLCRVEKLEEISIGVEMVGDVYLFASAIGTGRVFFLVRRFEPLSDASAAEFVVAIHDPRSLLLLDGFITDWTRVGVFLGLRSFGFDIGFGVIFP